MWLISLANRWNSNYHWGREAHATPRQLNGFDCGVFTLAWAEARSVGEEAVYQQPEMNDVRMGILYSLMSKNVD